MEIDNNEYFKTTVSKMNGLILITEVDKVANETTVIRFTPEQAAVLGKALRNF